jgi:WD40 repeat protein
VFVLCCQFRCLYVCVQVTSVSFSPDGRSIGSGSRDKTLIVWSGEESVGLFWDRRRRGAFVCDSWVGLAFVRAYRW